MARKAPTIEELRKMVPLLERMSLIYKNDKTVGRFQDTVMAAQLMREVDVNGVEPMYTVLEGRTVKVREDVIEKTDKKHVLEPSVRTVEDYFLLPPSNVTIDDVAKKHAA